MIFADGKHTIIKKHLHILAILAIATAVYFGMLENDFVSFDDDEFITENDAVKNFSWANVKSYFTASAQGHYMPLTLLVYATEYFLFGANPFWFHLASLLLHLFNAFLLYVFIARLSDNKNIAAMAALFFAVHPMNVEPVVWISAKSTLLYSFFFFSTLVCYQTYIRNKNRRFLAACFILFLMSLFSKSGAVMLPFVLLLLDYHYQRKALVKLLLEKLPFLIFSAVFVWVAMIVSADFGSLGYASFRYEWWESLFLVSYALLFYVVKFFAPVHLSAIHYNPLKEGSWLPIEYYAALPLLLLLTFLVYKLIRFELYNEGQTFKRQILFGIFFYLLTVLPFSQIISAGDVIAAERYAYLPYVGILIAFFSALHFLAVKHLQLKRVFFFILAVGFATFSVITYQRLKIWSNSISLYSDVIAKYPQRAYAYFGRGVAKTDRNEPQGALADYDKAIALSPKFVKALNNRGNVKMQLNRHKEALKDFEKATQIQPEYAEAWFNSAMAQTLLSNYSQAAHCYSKYLALESKNEIAWYNYGNMNKELGKLNESVDAYTRCIEINPNFTEAYNNRGISKYMQMDYAAAIVNFDKAIKVNSNFAEAFHNRGNAKYHIGNEADACLDWQKAAALGYAASKKNVKKFCRFK
ncbi:MAG: hypothetical protein COA57_04225 [Flavobacteriales bacterium]|nr:MAG: hypothetical protein COA57_04225 [Flavobacteriales bacterium]